MKCFTFYLSNTTLSGLFSYRSYVAEDLENSYKVGFLLDHKADSQWKLEAWEESWTPEQVYIEEKIKELVSLGQDAKSLETGKAWYKEVKKVPLQGMPEVGPEVWFDGDRSKVDFLKITEDLCKAV